MEVLSNFLLLKNPFFGQKESVIKLSEAAQQEAMIAEMMKCKELTVSHAGIACTKVKQGNKVYLDMDKVLSAARVTLKVEDKDEDYFIVRESDVIFIY